MAPSQPNNINNKIQTILSESFLNFLWTASIIIKIQNTSKKMHNPIINEIKKIMLNKNPKTSKTMNLSRFIDL